MGSFRIPVGDMAREHLAEIFPHLTPQQIEAIRAGAPVPPSPDWQVTRDRRRREQKAPSPHSFVVEDFDDTTTLPLVSCIMAFGVKERLRLAQKAVNQFVQQVYPKKQLVIVNATEVAVTNVPYYAIKEIRLPVGQISVGALRNAGLDAADGEYCMSWDDDDFYSAYRIAYQMLFREEGRAVLLSDQMRCNIDAGTVYLHRQNEGIAGTAVFPRTDARYPDASGGEDVGFWMANWGVRSIVVDNHDFPASCISLAVYHGNNVLSAESFMNGHVGQTSRGRWFVSEEEREHLMSVLATFGLRTEVRQAELE